MVQDPQVGGEVVGESRSREDSRRFRASWPAPVAGPLLLFNVIHVPYITQVSTIAAVGMSSRWLESFPSAN